MPAICFPRWGETAAERATAMLREKLAGRPVASEVPLPTFAPVPPPARDTGEIGDILGENAEEFVKELRRSV